MSVSLTPELEKFVDGKVESGIYNNASEVVREGLRLLKEHDEIRVKWREQIERGWLQAERGELVDGPAAMASIRERVKTKARKRASVRATGSHRLLSRMSTGLSISSLKTASKHWGPSSNEAQS